MSEQNRSEQRKAVNCLGLECPLPVIEAKQALASVEVGTWIDVSVDGQTQVQNLTRMANNQGFRVETEALGENFLVHIQKGEQKSETEVSSETAVAGPTTIVFASDRMGEGDDQLGQILMKSCVFSLTQLDPLPDRFIFYNGGVKLTCEGSPALEDLQRLNQAGVEIFSCGTCLKFLGLEDKLQVGQVSNMYEILEMQLASGRIIKP